MNIINLFSIIEIILLIYILGKKDTRQTKFINLVVVTSLLEIVYPQGYFFLFAGKSQISYQYVAETFLLIYSCYYIYRDHILLPPRTSGYTFLFFIIMFCSLCYEELIPCEKNVIADVSQWDLYIQGRIGLQQANIEFLRIVRIFIPCLSFSIALNIFKSKINRVSTFLALRKVLRWMNYYIFVICGEFIVKNLFDSNIISDITSFVFGVGVNTFIDLQMRGTLYQLRGFSPETSELSTSLFLFIIIYNADRLLSGDKVKTEPFVKKNLFIFLIMILTGSFSSMIYIFIVVVFSIMLYSAKNKVSIYKIIIASGFLFFISATLVNIIIAKDGFLANRLYGLVEYILPALYDNEIYFSSEMNVEGNFSTLSRLTSIIITFINVLDRPFIGLGLGVQTAHAGLVNILSDVGMLGVFSWLFMMLSDKKYYYLALTFFFFSATALTGGREFYYGAILILLSSACTRDDVLVGRINGSVSNEKIDSENI